MSVAPETATALSRLRAQRAQTAALALAAARVRQTQAERRLAQARAARAEFNRRRGVRAQQLFERLRSPAVATTARDMNDYQTALGELRDRSAQLEQQLLDAERQFGAAGLAVDTARQVWVKAMKADAKWRGLIAPHTFPIDKIYS